MAQTISELEKERAELLQAIESQAQQLSSKRNVASDAPVEHTLKDWLNAAEEVMPSNNPTRNTTRPNTSNTTPIAKNKTSKASFFGVIIMLSLLLTILGVLYIAYTSIHNELVKVANNNQATIDGFKSLQTEMEALKTSVASGGNGKLFNELQTKVSTLETELSAIKAQQTQMNQLIEKIQNQPNSTVAIAPTSTMQTTPTSPANTDSNLVTTEVLDRKLKAYTEQIDAKLEMIMQYLKMSPTAPTEPHAEVTPGSKQSEVNELPDISVNEPQTPKVKPLDQPLVKLVKTLPTPQQPTQPTTPLKNYTPDMNWLMNEPAFNFTLQLASMSDFASVQKMKDDKGLADAKIIPQTRNDSTTYVLIMGSFDNRSDADKAVNSLKANHNISPWVRKIKDITARVE